MKKNSLATALYLFLVFLSGSVVGVFGYRLYTVSSVTRAAPVAPKSPAPDDWRRKYVQEMSARLKLSPDQLSRLDQILDETKKNFDNLRDQYGTQKKGLEEGHATRVRAMLNAQQIEEYNKLREERRRRRELEKKSSN